MTQKPALKASLPPKQPSQSRKDALLILLALAGLVIAGIIFSRLVSSLELDNKVDVPNYPGSEKASLTAKGTRFIEDKYTSDKPSSDYYKVRLTSDSCNTVLGYYRTEAVKSGWSIDKQDGSDGPDVPVDSYSKSAKGLFVYCIAGSEQLAQDAGSRNIIILLTADSVLDLNPSFYGKVL